MNVRKLIVASVATMGVFRRFAQLSDEEKDEVVKKVKEKLNGKKDDGAEIDSTPDAEPDVDKDTDEGSDSGSEGDNLSKLQELSKKLEDPDSEGVEDETEPVDDGTDEDSEPSEDDSGVLDVGDEDGFEDDDEEVEVNPEPEEEPEPDVEPEAESEAGPEVDEEKKEEISDIVNNLVQEVETIKNDGHVAPKDVLGLLTSMMEMVGLLVEAKAPTRRRKKASSREDTIAMRVAGRILTPQYIVKVNDYQVYPGRSHMTDAAWRREYGRPSPQSIKRYVETYNASLEPRGVNSHLGRQGAIYGARIVDQFSGETVAEWSDRGIVAFYKSKPMFEVVE